MAPQESNPNALLSVDELVDGTEPRIESDLDESDSLQAIGGTIRSYVGVPVLADTDERLGILCVASSLPDAFDETAIESLADLADLVAGALRNAGANGSDMRHNDFLDHISDEFRQESEGLRRAHDGRGLGLTITRRLVERMGGRIEAESTKGEGSACTVWLPRAPTEDRPSTPEQPGTT